MEAANNTPRFVVKWMETESFQPTISCRNRAAEVTCATLIEALSIFHLETTNTNLKKVSELDYTPSDKEWNQRVTYLVVLTTLMKTPSWKKRQASIITSMTDILPENKCVRVSLL